MADAESRQTSSPRVFLSYSHSDRPVAERIAAALSEAGTKVWFDQFEIELGASLADEIDGALRASDFVVVLLSGQSVQSKWVQQELAAAYGREMETRAVTVVPVLLEDCDLPPVLALKQYFDLRTDVDGGIRALASRLSGATQFDLSTLSAGAFEELVADLLKALSFDVKLTTEGREGVDFIATHRGADPFGAEHRERYLVVCKHYRHRRADLDSVRTMAEALSRDPEASAGLLVTSGQFTSPVREWAGDQAENGVRLRLLDGTELRRLLLGHPEVARKHLAKAP